MTELLQRQSLASLVAEELRGRIRAGRYPGFLPGEPILARELGVSRTVLREALAALAKESWIFRARGRRTRIKPDRERKSTRRHVLIITDEPGPLSPGQQETLRQLEHALTLEHMSFQEVKLDPKLRPGGREWTRLIRHHPPETGWILHGCRPRTQLAWAQAGLPCLVVGSCHPGISLPSIDHNYGAVARHAAGQFLRLGHRKLALVQPERPKAGDELALQAFRTEAIRGGASCLVLPTTSWDRGKSKQPQPGVPRFTALYVLRVESALHIHSLWTHQGIQIPGDCALLCRDYHPHFELLTPPLAGYTYPSLRLLRGAARMMENLLAGRGSTRRPSQLYPRLISAPSLG